MPVTTRPIDQRRYTATRRTGAQSPPPPFHAPSTARPSATRAANLTPRPAISAGAQFAPPPPVTEVDPSNPMTFPRLANGQTAVVFS